jgi:hypothetical protein
LFTVLLKFNPASYPQFQINYYGKKALKTIGFFI